MTNCLNPKPSNDVASAETPRPYSATLPDRERWPNTRRALVLWTQEHLDRELERMPRPMWFDRALALHLDPPRDALTKAHDAMFERIRERER